jgi:hypothetical protein
MQVWPGLAWLLPRFISHDKNGQTLAALLMIEFCSIFAPRISKIPIVYHHQELE